MVKFIGSVSMYRLIGSFVWWETVKTMRNNELEKSGG